VRESGYWEDGYRQRKFKKLRAKHSTYHHEVACMQGSNLTKRQLLAWGGEHFARYGISEKELDGFLDYVRHLELLVFEVRDSTVGDHARAWAGLWELLSVESCVSQ
jgi:hypothetical protein